MARYWLFKSDPETFGWEDLAKAPKKTTTWDGVRNYQARNLLRDEVKVGDGVLFYHSSTKPQAVVGTAEVVGGSVPDPTQFDPESDHYDPQASRGEPRWWQVDIRLDRALPRPVTLEEMRETKALSKMVLLKRGMRLSVQPVTPEEWRTVLKLGEK